MNTIFNQDLVQQRLSTQRILQETYWVVWQAASSTSSLEICNWWPLLLCLKRPLFAKSLWPSRWLWWLCGSLFALIEVIPILRSWSSIPYVPEMLCLDEHKGFLDKGLNLQLRMHLCVRRLNDIIMDSKIIRLKNSNYLEVILSITFQPLMYTLFLLRTSKFWPSLIVLNFSGNFSLNCS